MVKNRKTPSYGLRYQTRIMSFLSVSTRPLFKNITSIIPSYYAQPPPDFFRLNQTPFTQLKTAIISIKRYRPMFTRVPLGGKGGMSGEAVLAVECDVFAYIGSAGEDMFGSPKSMENNPDIYEWSNGLRKDGGAGCVIRPSHS
jgi:hypothetical protein